MKTQYAGMVSILATKKLILKVDQVSDEYCDDIFMLLAETIFSNRGYDTTFRFRQKNMIGRRWAMKADLKFIILRMRKYGIRKA